jgi:hypothetical protein
VIHIRSLLGDRKRRQRGSILSSLLIIVALLSILVGALMTDLTSSFLISRTLVARVQHEATLTSAAELGIHQLQTSLPSPVCARDGRGPWSLTLNSTSASVSPTCQAIVPDVARGLVTGAFTIDGVHDTSAGRDRYLVSGSGGVLRAYGFGQTAPSWSVQIGGAQTATLLPKVDSSGSAVLLIPAAIPGSGCGGQCVALFNEGTDPPQFRCSMPSTTTVTTTPAAELTASGSPNFPDYVFFSDSAGAGRLYVYNGAAAGSCDQRASVALGGLAVGSPLVLPGAVSGSKKNPTINDEIFVLVTSGNSTSLKDFRYSESIQNCDGENCDNDTTGTLSQISSFPLGGAFGGNATGYAASSTSATIGSTLNLAIANAAGRLAIAQIAVTRGPAYRVSSASAGALPGGIARPPYWCHCPGGQDEIGVGSTNGSLYVFSNKLVIEWVYDGQADGAPAINSIPMADANGDWYFGADDGYVYDVEIPTTGVKMFKAARFGPGGAIRSSPIVGAPADGCLSGPCLYFASTSAGSYFVRLGGTRIFDLQVCMSTASGSTTCVGNPRLWARVEVGPPSVVGGSGVYVKGWSYYSP